MNTQDILAYAMTLDHKARRELAAQIVKADREAILATKPNVPGVGSTVKLVREYKGFDKGTELTVTASGPGNGGWTYAQCQFPEGTTQFVPLKVLQA